MAPHGSSGRGRGLAFGGSSTWRATSLGFPSAQGCLAGTPCRETLAGVRHPPRAPLGPGGVRRHRGANGSIPEGGLAPLMTAVEAGGVGHEVRARADGADTPALCRVKVPWARCRSPGEGPDGQIARSCPAPTRVPTFPKRTRGAGTASPPFATRGWRHPAIGHGMEFRLLGHLPVRQSGTAVVGSEA